MGKITCIIPEFVKIIIMLIICLTIAFTTTYPKNIKVYGSNVHLKKPELKFKKDGTFKIVQFADIQDGPVLDSRTSDLMNNILDNEKPDFVILTGDNIDGKCKSVDDVKKAINNISEPIEKRKIPWSIVFGNHDDEHGFMNKEEMMKLYMKYPNNISEIGPKNINGIGNYNIPIKDSSLNNTIFNLYMLDSGTYAPKIIGGYDWIKFNQIDWYRNTSYKLKKKYNKSIPSLMFFHIPLQEWKIAWDSGKSTGYKNEEECPSKINSGLFSALLETGDVKGVFVGHDHVNDYVGELCGIQLGYSRNVGYATYGKDDFSRGARVFQIKESDPDKFDTWMRLVSDFK